MSFSRNVAKLATGTTVGQALNILSIPVLSRIFAPEQFGGAALFVSIIRICSPIMCLRYELSIMLPKSDKDSAGLFQLCLAITFILSFISVLILMFVEYFLPEIIDRSIKNFLFLIPITLLISGFSLPLRTWSTRKKFFGTLSASKLTLAGCSNGTKILAGLSGFASSGGLILGDIVGRTAELSLLVFQTFKFHRKRFTLRVGRQEFLKLIKRYRKFPIFSSCSSSSVHCLPALPNSDPQEQPLTIS